MYESILSKLKENEIIISITIFTKGMHHFRGTLDDVKSDEDNVEACYIYTNKRVFIVSNKLKS